MRAVFIKPEETGAQTAPRLRTLADIPAKAGHFHLFCTTLSWNAVYHAPWDDNLPVPAEGMLRRGMSAEKWCSFSWNFYLYLLCPNL